MLQLLNYRSVFCKMSSSQVTANFNLSHYIRKRFCYLILGAAMMSCEQKAARQETLRGQKYCASTKKNANKTKQKQKQDAPGVFLTSRSFLARRFLLHNSSLRRGLLGKAFTNLMQQVKVRRDLKRARFTKLI